MLLAPFGVLRNGEPIDTYPLRRGLNTGLSFADARMSVGLVSEYEERETAIFNSYGWEDWLALDYRERAAAVAHFRIHHLIERHVEDASAEDMRRRHRAGGAD